MPFYWPLKKMEREDKTRTVKGLQALRSYRAKNIPDRTLNKTLLLATWNLRDFGNEDKRGQKDGQGFPGPRLEESYYYIAEVISAFDIVAIQEINDLESLKRVMEILGPSWDYLVSDINPSKGGNFEHMTFVFDKRKVRFDHMAGQIVTNKKQQFVRTPYYASFQSGWFKFSLCTVHILYGDYKNTEKRIGEIDEIASFLSDRVERTNENMILLGDFNILSRKDPTFKPLNDHGWTVPMSFKTNVQENKEYDQIAFKTKPKELKRGPSKPNAGAYNFFDSVFRKTEWQTYHDVAKSTGRRMDSWDATVNWPAKDRVLTHKEYFAQWRTWQISDHFPLWVELEIDFTDDYLNRL